MSDKKTSRTYSCECGKSYKARSGLWKHKKICNYKEPEVKEGDKNTKLINVLKEYITPLVDNNKMLTDRHMMLTSMIIANLEDKVKSYEDEIEQLKYDKKKLISVNEVWKDSFNYLVNHNQ